MPFDDAKFYEAARQHQVGQVALTASIALQAILSSLRKIGAQADISEELETIQDQVKRLGDTFDSLTGYTKP